MCNMKSFAMEDEVKETDEKSETTEEKVKKLSCVYEGDFYLNAENYRKALESYKKAQEKEKLKELAEVCGKRGEGRVALEAMRAAEGFVSKDALKSWGNKALEYGMLRDALFVLIEAGCISELPDGHTILFGIDRELFLRCGDIIFFRAEKYISEGKKEDAVKAMEDAARAYEVGNKPKKIAEIGSWFLREVPLQGDPNTRKAQEFYTRAARLEIAMQKAEEDWKKLCELEAKCDVMAGKPDKKEGKPLFTSEELTKAAEEAAKCEEEVPFAPAGRSKKPDEKK